MQNSYGGKFERTNQKNVMIFENFKEAFSLFKQMHFIVYL